jgi:hypothetical protein
MYLFKVLPFPPTWAYFRLGKLLDAGMRGERRGLSIMVRRKISFSLMSPPTHWICFKTLRLEQQKTLQ